MAITVLGRVSSINVRKVLWVLDELQFVYDREDWGAGFADAKSPQFLILNPNGQVPVIRDDGFVLWESNAIMRYFSEKRPGVLMPGDGQDRALAEQWLGWQATELNPAWVYAVMAILRKHPDYTDEKRITQSIAAWGRQMGMLDAQLARTGAYVAGEAFTLADIAIGLSVHRWKRVAFDKPEFGHVEAYYQRLLERKAGTTYMAPDMA